MKSGLSRRTVLKLMGGTGASFALGSFVSAACASTPEGEQKGDPFSPSAFLRIDPDGTCTVTVSRSDMGQGVRTTFAMLVAEELDADWSKVKVAQAPGNDEIYGRLGTGGSSSVRGMNRTLRNVGATARAMLVAAAAKQWNVDPTTCRTEKGKVVGADGKTLDYGKLAMAAKEVPVPQGVQLKDAANFKIIGKPTSRIDNDEVVTGRALFAYDVSVPGMVYAVCARPPSFGSRPLGLDDSAARKVPGVIDIIPISSGIAIIAKNTWAALKGKDALKVEWSGHNQEVSTASLRAGLKSAVAAHLEMPAGAKTIEANYELPYLAHATMEPLAAVADVKSDSAELWSGTQAPDSARDQVARLIGVPKEKVVVNNLVLGGGFGRKFNNHAIGEAADLSKRVGKPVKLLWSRECDMQNDLYRPMSEHAFKSTIDGQGNLLGWSHQYIQTPGGRASDYNANAYLPYDIPNAAMRSAGSPSPVPTGAWRSVEHSQIIVANECFMDELATAAGQDPYQFRRKLLKSERVRKVLDSAAQKAGWGEKLPKGMGRGIACFEGYGSCIAHVVDVEVKGNVVRVVRMVAVVDPGVAINPRGIEAQVQGGFTDGLATALKAAINIDKGGAVESNWDGYEWARMTDSPEMKIFVEPSGGNFGGMGEVGYPSAPAAIANAIFAATGKRARKFPIKVEELV